MVEHKTDQKSLNESPALLSPAAPLTFGDVVKNYAPSAAEDTALQCWTVQMEAVDGVWRRVVVKYGQVARN